MKRIAACAIAAVLGMAAKSPPAMAGCRLQSATLPVTMLGKRPLLSAKINGEDALFVVDSGAFFSAIMPASADKFRLHRIGLPFGASVEGTTGIASADATKVEVFTLASTPIHNLQFLVTGGAIGEGAAGLIGQNVLGIFDVDYDLANGAVRLMHPDGCAGVSLATWAVDRPYSVVPLERSDSRHTLTTVYLNGVRLTALLDTGATTTIISQRAAARAGVTAKTDGVTRAGQVGGIGDRMTPIWLGSFESFKIGGEEIKRSNILFGDIYLSQADVLLGVDFFLSHHILVSNSQRNLYFTYNGGPVFNLDVTPHENWGNAPPPAVEPSTEPADAPTLALRGAALASRQQFPSAIADLTKAIELAPTNPDYVYDRGRAYLSAHQRAEALADFNHVLKLKPEYIAALVARAAIELDGGDKAAALQDLTSADKAAAKQDDVRFALAELYERADDLGEAGAQFDLWIQTHPDGSGTPQALNGRSWVRALSGRDLDKALLDSNRSLKLSPNNPAYLDTRGLVHLRRGEFDAAIRDYDAALSVNPKQVWSLYGRGLAKRLKGDAVGSSTDLSAAAAINPRIAEEAARRGVDPSNLKPNT